MIKKTAYVLNLFVCIIFSQSYATSTQSTKSPIIEAITNNDLQEVKALIESGIDLNDTINIRSNPLCHAICMKNIQIISSILDAGADASKLYFNHDMYVDTDKNDALPEAIFSPLHLALMPDEEDESYPEQVEIVRMLIKAGADTNAKGYTEDRNEICITPLILAFISNNIEVIKVLIENGADVNYGINFDEWRNARFLHFIALAPIDSFNRFEIMELLLDAGVDINTTTDADQTALHFIAEDGGTIEQAQTVVAFGADINYASIDGITPLIDACISGNTDVAEYLIKSGADVHAKTHRGFSALDYAQGYNYSETAQLLIAAGADQNVENKTFVALNRAINKQETDTALALISTHLNLNRTDDNYSPPLVLAAKKNNPILIKALLEAGADPNLTDREGNSALSQCTDEKHQETFDILVKFGANASLLSKDNTYPKRDIYFDGEAHRKKKTLEAILNTGIDINYLEQDGIPLLLHACLSDDAHLVQKLINMNAQVNLAGEHGKTPLHMAVKLGNKKIVRMLINAGADVNSISNKGYTPLFWASYIGHIEIVNLLIEAGALVN